MSHNSETQLYNSSHINTLATTKRAHALVSGNDDDDDDDDDDDNEHAGASISDDSSVVDIDESCDQVRRKIRNFLEAGAMKVTHFQREIDVNPSSYGNFMKQKGRFGGANNQTYVAAYRFFKKREKAGIKIPRKNSANKKQKTSSSEGGDAGAGAGAKKKKKKNGAKATPPGEEVADVHLPGEETQTVPIYDTCDEIRRKINAHLRKDDVIQASFLRSLSAQFPEPRSITSKQLTDFRSKKGPRAGNSSGVFYAAYVYFEKLRIKDGKKKKTKTREEMERVWGASGVSLRPDNSRGFLCGPGQRPVEDKYGKVSFVGGRF
ncbi:MAG: hypothetical protein M1835_003682 [Candelina submexicana]|nr:MAG: hypothetical protein M1835_003682 [Candelina submexicana]